MITKEITETKNEMSKKIINNYSRILKSQSVCYMPLSVCPQINWKSTDQKFIQLRRNMCYGEP